MSAEYAFAFWHLGPELEILERQFIRSPGAAPLQFEGPVRCDAGEPTYVSVDDVLMYVPKRSFAWRDGALVVAGAYDRSRVFCSDMEEPAVVEEVPLHECGIYLLRFRPGM